MVGPMLKSLAAGLTGAALLGALPLGADENDNILFLDLKSGRVVIEMRPDLAPGHVARIKELVRQGFYDGVKFHRVIDGFMAQTGDPTGTGRGGSGQKLRAEFSDELHERGTLSMARARDPNSADSQFFIVFDRAPHLDGQYTVWGRVVDGMDFVDAIKRGDGSNGEVRDADTIVRALVAADEYGSEEQPVSQPAPDGKSETRE